MIKVMSSFFAPLLISYLFFQKSHACAKQRDTKLLDCDVHSYYYGNCTYDRFGIREQLRLPEGLSLSFIQCSVIDYY